MKDKIEILAPAGSPESLRAAVTAGADAVYVGGTLFGARAYAHNLSKEELLAAIDFVHLHGRKIYLTVNTLLKESEIQERLYGYLLPFYQQGLDAVIVQDVGVLSFVREYFPELPIHASTQMTITGVGGAKFLERAGASRVVTARELQLKEVSLIAKETSLEIESFVHGALCYCYSGQCLFSSFLGGRSGNRGQCAQPCRLPYRTEGDRYRYLLSLKDICTLDLIPELMESGIDSFKIEGRMKKPEYVAAASFLYRKYADLYHELRKRAPDGMDAAVYAKERFKAEEKDKEMLLDLYNRGGSCTGYYHMANGREMVSLDRPNHAGIPAVKVMKRQGNRVFGKALVDLSPQDVIELPIRKGQEQARNVTCRSAVAKGNEICLPAGQDVSFKKGDIWYRVRNEKLIQDLNSRFTDRKIKEKLNGKFILSAGEFATLTVYTDKVPVTVTGGRGEEAQQRPLDLEKVKRQLEKTGDTEFEFGRLDIEINGKVFLPMQNINALRRDALDYFEKEFISRYRRGEPKQQRRIGKSRIRLSKEVVFTASAQTTAQIEALLEAEEITRIYADCTAFPHIWKNGAASVIEAAHRKHKEIYLIMPYIFRESARKRYEEGYETIFCAGWDGVLIRNYDSFWFLGEHGFAKPVVTDYNLYQFNDYAKKFWEDEGADGFTAPLELTARELGDLDISQGETVVYGYLPLMVSAGCVVKTTGQCKKESGQMTITDRYRKQFVVKNECDYCYNVIYNQVPLFLADQMQEVYKAGAGRLRLMFTWESAEKVREILKLYREKKGLPEGTFTRGHWKSGIK
ncbi:MAG: U32 family peptidase [Coprococcus sp.]|nr:U32 family peptidase [Coprococcus sp.]